MKITLPALGALAVLTFATAASAAPVTVSFSPEFQEALNDDLGVREGASLQTTVTRAINDALGRRGVAAAEGSIEVSIIDADPNRPTMQQIADTPGLDAIHSVSLGGAQLHAVLRGSDGRVLTEVDHRRYDYGIDEYQVGAPTTWTGARRAIRQFAEKVADAYVANTR